MSVVSRWFAVVVVVLAVGSACMPAWAEAGPGGGTLRAFSSQAQLDALLADWQRKAEKAQRRERALYSMSPAAPPAPAAAPASASMDQVTVTGSRIDGAESITNVQTVGVDEGGIVKQHGQHLVVLRRGRLFTVRIGGDALSPVSVADAYAPGVDGRGTWYDEMLISGNTVVVIGFSYARGGTEIGLFDIDARGRLNYRDTYHMRGNDYYSARNYASRLIGNTLIFYTPLYYNRWQGQLNWPGLRRWHPQATPDEFQRILPATNIFRADAGLDPLNDGIALHTVTRCELAVQPMRCEATGVLGPAGRVFYVSRDAVYVWTQRGARGRGDAAPPPGMAVRLPLDGSAPSGLNVRGAPIDQMSFLESGDGHLNVLLQSSGRGEAMWLPEWGSGRMALLRVPVARFGDERAMAVADDYRLLPAVPAGNRQNRFVGDWLLYGSAPWGMRRAQAIEVGASRAYALRWAQRQPVVSLAPSHGVERIEAMGGDAVLVGNDADALVFSAVSLSGDVVGIRDGHRIEGSTQAERRTHGFFYRNDGEQRGVIGLPVMRDGASASHGFLGAPDGGAAVTFLRNDALRWQPLGELEARPEVRDDGCVASCVDWYGNARPIFIGQRVFALMGYELVEGRVEDGAVRERRRVDFAPVKVAVGE